MSVIRFMRFVLSIFFYLTAATASATVEPDAPDALLHASYDPTRELFREINNAFTAHWRKQRSAKIVVNQSHAGSASQARAVIAGLPADVVSLAFPHDIDAISDSGLTSKQWRGRLPNASSPFSSAIVFLVRQGNPKSIRDWPDLIRPGVSVVTPNPKTSGGARWNYLAAWGNELLRTGGDEGKARAFISALFRNVKVMDASARGATTTFAQRGIGDVLITWESEAHLVLREFGDKNFAVVAPPRSIRAEPVVAVIDKVVDSKGTRSLATDYLKYLYTEEAQRIAANNFFRPVNTQVAAAVSQPFTPIDLFTLESVFGDASKVQATHFADGGVFDQITAVNS